MSILMISLIAGLSILTIALAVVWILAAPKPRGWNEYRQASRATREEPRRVFRSCGAFLSKWALLPDRKTP